MKLHVFLLRIQLQTTFDCYSSYTNNTDTEAYSEPSPTSMTNFFEKIVKGFQDTEHKRLN